MSWYLYGTGKRAHTEWDTLLKLDLSWTASWADHHGFHHEPLPTQPPRTTHLWAWAPHHWLRIRIDHDHWWAALLTQDHHITDPLWTTPEEQPEQITQPDIAHFTNWGGAREAKQYRPAPGAEHLLHRHDMLQLTPLRRTTATFIGNTTTH